MLWEEDGPHCTSPHLHKAVLSPAQGITSDPEGSAASLCGEKLIVYVNGVKWRNGLGPVFGGLQESGAVQEA